MDNSRRATFSRLLEQSAQLQRNRAQHLGRAFSWMGSDMERVRTMTPRERVLDLAYTAAAFVLIVTLLLGSTVGLVDAYDEPAPAIVEAIRDARVAAREAQLPEPWPPR